MRSSGNPNGPGRARHAEPAGSEVVRHPAAYPCDERGARRRAGAVRRPERHSQAFVPDRVQLPHRSGRLSPPDATLVRRHERARPEAWFVVRPGLSHDPVSWRRRPGREALRFQTKPPPEGNSGLFGPGWGETFLLLRQQRPAERPTGRRDPAVRPLLEETHRQAAGRTDLRFQAHDLCQAEQT